MSGGGIHHIKWGQSKRRKEQETGSRIRVGHPSTEEKETLETDKQKGEKWYQSWKKLYHKLEPEMKAVTRKTLRDPTAEDFPQLKQDRKNHNSQTQITRPKTPLSDAFLYRPRDDPVSWGGEDRNVTMKEYEIEIKVVWRADGVE